LFRRLEPPRDPRAQPAARHFVLRGNLAIYICYTPFKRRALMTTQWILVVSFSFGSIAALMVALAWADYTTTKHLREKSQKQ
jgi:hypothetical protein